VTEPDQIPDPRAMDDQELAQTPEPPAPATDPTADPAEAEDAYAEGRTSDPDDAQRDVPAGEDYAGSGF
jgi:hypothetical protein